MYITDVSDCTGPSSGSTKRNKNRTNCEKKQTYNYDLPAMEYQGSANRVPSFICGGGAITVRPLPIVVICL